MRISLAPALLLLLAFVFSSCTTEPQQVLIFSKTKGYRHASIEVGVQALSDHLKSKGIQVESTEDASYFTEEVLQQYSAVIFLNTTGDILDHYQQADFERYIQAGGGFVGIHSATDTEYDWPWYNRLVGAYFASHPKVQEARTHILQPTDPACQHVPADWSIKEEWYNFRSLNPEVEILMEVDESSYEGGKHGDHHPIVWKHEYDGGRAFYTAMGHMEETFSDPLFLQQVYAGVQFAMGANKRNYAKARSQRVPEENRFSKTVLDFNLNEPMELEELGDRGILFVERRGLLKLYEFQTAQTRTLDSLDVYYANEDGLLGVAVDPKFEENQWLYLFYSPNISEATQHVSRFTLKDDQLTDERILLKVPLIRKCCHSGGSLEFGPDGLLYIGIGDNTNPFESNGFAPIDERSGRQLYDAQRSAGNTNDLRGKILRIKPEDDGTYSIPEGNLFPEGTPNSRPEIYVMGCRNPFRISIDPTTNYLYWGDVGPDAGAADSMRGPAGMGEFNQARKAGFYGWPYSRGNNQMYTDFDFVSNRSGERFQATKIVNRSPNNTGLQELPPVEESMIWYSYQPMKQFPWLGEGGVNPMSGPVFRKEDFESAEHPFPDYFHNKWFVYEWMRDWIYLVHLDEDQQYVQAEPFMPNTEFSHPMDMLFGKDGKLYVLEYGQKWNSRNLDARLSVIHYNAGNRPPVAQVVSDQEVGAVPLTVQFSAANSYDDDQDALTYSWSVGEERMNASSAEFSYTFEEAGRYEVVLTVTDEDGESASSNQKILVGNEPPKLSIELENENNTYWRNRRLGYQIKVSDREDGSTTEESIDPSRVKVTFNFIPEGEDMILASVGHQQNTAPKGLQLIDASDCKACHAIDQKVAGPSFQDIAARYTQDDKEILMHRIIKGSRGNWGEQMMAPHPQLSIDEVGEMVSYILSLDPNKQVENQHLGLSGTLRFDQHSRNAEGGKYVLIASYLDEGHPEVPGSSLSVMEEVVFFAPKIELEDAVDLDKALGTWNMQGRRVVGSIQHGRHLQMPAISFDKLASVSIGAAFGKDYAYGGTIEVRKGSADGPLLGSKTIQHFDKNKEVFPVYEIPLTPSEGFAPLFLVFSNPENEDQYTMNGDWLQLNYEE